jgi:RNA polymerase sigma-70 factor, ECF subfamily
MPVSSSQDVTQLLKAWAAGDEQSLELLTPLVYEQLRRVAQRHMANERRSHTLQTTALVHELYIRLVDCRQTDWQDRAHFFAVSAHLMRRILIDFARSYRSQKRGGGVAPVLLDEALIVCNRPDSNLVALDDALQLLAAVDARKGRIVELKFFGGLSIEEIAAVLKVSAETVVRDWRLAKSWLLRQMTGETSVGV